MKRLLTILLAAFAIASCNDQNTTTFSGKIIGYNGEYTEFFLPADTPGEWVEIPIKVAEDGTFSTKLKMDKDWWDAALFVDKFMFRTCIERGKKYYAEFDITVPDVEDRFHFTGDGEKENEFTRVYFNQFAFVWNLLDNIDDVCFKEYSDIVKAKGDECRDLMNACENPGLTDYYTPEIEKIENLISFYFPYVSLAKKGDVVDDPDFNEFVSNARLDEMEPDKIQELFNGVASYAASLKGLDILKAVKLAQSHFSKKENADFAMTSLLRQYMGIGNTQGLKEAYEWYLEQQPDDSYVAQVADLYKATMALLPGGDTPELEMMDPEGNTLKLSDLYGKVLYIDFWATWCGPCRAEIPFMEKIAAKYADSKDIQCISISLDEDIEAWKADIAEAKPAWPQYVLTEKGQQQVADDFKISSIPRFVIIDSKGKIFDVNSQRPSSSGVAAQIESAVK